MKMGIALKSEVVVDIQNNDGCVFCCNQVLFKLTGMNIAKDILCLLSCGSGTVGLDKMVPNISKIT